MVGQFLEFFHTFILYFLNTLFILLRILLIHNGINHRNRNKTGKIMVVEFYLYFTVFNQITSSFFFYLKPYKILNSESEIKFIELTIFEIFLVSFVNIRVRLY